LSLHCEMRAATAVRLASRTEGLKRMTRIERKRQDLVGEH
jgi:hypothetical protein